MTKHLSKNNRFNLTIRVLEGASFSQVATRFGISKAGAAKIFHRTVKRVFPLSYEREALGIDMENQKSLKNAWTKVRGITL